MSETAVTSFVVRFTQEPEVSPAAWRGLIRHVQTSEETYFTQIEDALQFIAKFVELGEGNVAANTQPPMPNP